MVWESFNNEETVKTNKKPKKRLPSCPHAGSQTANPQQALRPPAWANSLRLHPLAAERPQEERSVGARGALRGAWPLPWSGAVMETSQVGASRFRSE